MSFDIIRLTQEALWLILVLSAPVIITASLSGLIVSIIQAVTQIQEQTIPFAVKLVAVAITIFLCAGMMSETLHEYTEHIFTDFPNMVKS